MTDYGSSVAKFMMVRMMGWRGMGGNQLRPAAPWVVDVSLLEKTGSGGGEIGSCGGGWGWGCRLGMVKANDGGEGDSYYRQRLMAIIRRCRCALSMHMLL